MLKVKLTRIGKKNQPQYRVVIAEARSKRDGAHTDRIGYYNPLTDPAEFKIDIEKYNDWLAKGAQPTDTVRHLVNKFNAPKKKTSAKSGSASGGKKPVKKPTKSTKK